MIQDVEQLLDSLALSTAGRIREDRQYGLHPHEETLTQNLVSDMRRVFSASGHRVFAREITRDEESKLYGADLALWFQDATGDLAGIHLQAKRQYSDDTYRGLDHSNARGNQWDLLVSGAASVGADAGYAFYNGLEDGQPAETICSRGILDSGSHGVNLARAASIRPHIARVVARTELESLCSPLRCLLACSATVAPTDQVQLAGALLRWQGGAGLKLMASNEAPDYLAPLLAAAGGAISSVPIEENPEFEDQPTPSDRGDDMQSRRETVDDGGAAVAVMLVTRVGVTAYD